LVIHSVPVADAMADGPHTVLVLVDLSDTPKPRPASLEQLFGLTRAEARLAVQFASGCTPAHIAAENGLSLATVRSQLASVFAKTQTSRQTELVALLARVAILP
jgi:DNA-binding CsgD family transcriptional regulator